MKERQDMGQQNTTETEVADLDGLLLMERIGGGFASNLARAWMKADLQNRRNLQTMFGYLLEHYKGHVRTERKRRPTPDWKVAQTVDASGKATLHFSPPAR